jgi:hypothetical protein
MPIYWIDGYYVYYDLCSSEGMCLYHQVTYNIIIFVVSSNVLSESAHNDHGEDTWNIWVVSIHI